MKKTLSIIILVCVLVNSMVLSIYAINLSLTTTRISVNGDSILVSNNKLEEAISITTDEAAYIAELFISDMIGEENCCWDEVTEIVDIVTLYNETGTSATAYSVELTEGYIVISAFSDSQSLIPEWSDTASPLYDNLEKDDSDNIVYLGSYEYYVDTSSTTVTDIDGNTVNKSELVNYVENSRDISNMPETLLESCVVNTGLTLFGQDSNNIDDGLDDWGTITDPRDHANYYYTGPFTTTNYYNEWEEYMSYCTTDLGSSLGWSNSCGPVAITNIIASYKNRYSYRTDIPTADNICDYVAEYGSTHTKTLNNITYYYYLPQDLYTQKAGTDVGRCPYYILDCLYYYDIPTNVVGNYESSYESIKYHLEEGCLLYMTLNGHSIYKNHAIVCFAYTRMVSSKTGFYKTYLKIADGWSNSPRYLNLSDILCVYNDDGSRKQGSWYTKIGLWG